MILSSRKGVDTIRLRITPSYQVFMYRVIYLDPKLQEDVVANGYPSSRKYIMHFLSIPFILSLILCYGGSDLTHLHGQKMDS